MIRAGKRRRESGLCQQRTHASPRRCPSDQDASRPPGGRTSCSDCQVCRRSESLRVICDVHGQRREQGLLSSDNSHLGEGDGRDRTDAPAGNNPKCPPGRMHKKLQ